MDLRFVAPELRALDGIAGDTLIVAHCEGERPLRGIAGAIDWRLGGRLSRLVAAGRASGELGHTVLVPGKPRLSFERVALLGLGPREALDEARAREATLAMIAVLDGLVARTAAIALPGRADEARSVESAVELLLGCVEGTHEVDELFVLEPPDAARAVAPVLERARRRARASSEP